MATYEEVKKVLGPGPEHKGMAALLSGEIPGVGAVISEASVSGIVSLEDSTGVVVRGTRNPLTSPEPVVWEIDNIGPWGVTIDVGHHQRHEGESFGACFADDALADTEQINLLIKPQATTYPHMLYHVTCPSAFTIQLYKDVSATVDGSAVKVLNHNQNMDVSANTLIYHTPTIASTGSLMEQYYIGGGSQRAGGSNRSEGEWILKPEVNYLLRVTSRANGNSGSVVLDWYEEGVAV